MLAAFTLRRLDDHQLDAWIREQLPESRGHRLGLREFRRRQEACHREHDMVAVRFGLSVGILLLGAAFGAVMAIG